MDGRKSEKQCGRRRASQKMAFLQAIPTGFDRIRKLTTQYVRCIFSGRGYPSPFKPSGLRLAAQVKGDLTAFTVAHEHQDSAELLPTRLHNLPHYPNSSSFPSPPFKLLSPTPRLSTCRVEIPLGL